VIRGGLRQIGSGLLAFAIFPVISNNLDIGRLGVWSLIAACAVFLSLSELGLSVAVQRAIVRKDRVSVGDIIALSDRVQILILPLIVLSSMVYVTYSLASSIDFADEVRTCAAIAMIGGALTANVLVREAALVALGYPNQIATIRATTSLVQLILLVALLHFHKSLTVVAIAFMLSQLWQFAFVRLTWRKLGRAYDSGSSASKLWVLRSVYRDCSAQLAINLSIVMALRIDLFIVGWIAYERVSSDALSDAARKAASLEIVGAYALATKIIEMAYLLLKRGLAVLVNPLGDENRRAQTVVAGCRVFSCAVACVMACVVLVGEPALMLVIGPVFEFVDPTILVILAISAVVLSTYEVPASAIMLCAPSAWQCATPLVLGAVVNFFVSIVGGFFFGPIAVAAGTLSGCVFTCLLVWRSLAKIPGVTASFTSVLTPVALSGLLIISVVYLSLTLVSLGVISSVGISLLAMTAGLIALACLSGKNFGKV